MSLHSVRAYAYDLLALSRWPGTLDKTWSKKFSQKELQNWMLDCQKKKLRLDQLTDALLAYGYFIGIALVNIFLILPVFFIHVLIFVVPAEIPG